MMKKNKIFALTLRATSLLLAIVMTVGSCTFLNTSYENAPDEWRHSWLINDRYTIKQALTELTAAADTGDREAFKKMFAPNLYNSEGFDEQLDTFFSCYPGGLCNEENDFSEMYYGGMGERKTHSGKSRYTYSTGGTVTANGEYYHIYLKICNKDENDPDEVGVMMFYVMSLCGWARELYDDHYYGTVKKHFYDEFENDPKLLCVMNNNQDVRLIDGWIYVFEPQEGRHLTEDDILKAVDKSIEDIDHVSEFSLKDILGERDGEDADINVFSWSKGIVYMLDEQNGVQRYAVIELSAYTVERIKICTEGMRGEGESRVIYDHINEKYKKNETGENNDEEI